MKKSLTFLKQPNIDVGFKENIYFKSVPYNYYVFLFYANIYTFFKSKLVVYF